MAPKPPPQRPRRSKVTCSHCQSISFRHFLLQSPLIGSFLSSLHRSPFPLLPPLPQTPHPQWGL
eukprot:8033536-Prorocentrum_lima.AAC.1